MTNIIRKYEEVACPTCGAQPGQSCISKQSGRDLETQNKKRARVRSANYAHTERMQRYEKKTYRPIDHKGWPVGRSPE